MKETQGASRAFLELGRYFRQLREKRHVSQVELASRSSGAAFPVDQSYVSRLERGDVAGSVGKFFTVLSLVNADSAQVSELLRLGPASGGAEEASLDECLAHARSSAENGQLTESLSWALSALFQANASRDAEAEARCLVSASIVLKNRGAREIARSLAFRALNLTGTSKKVRLQATLQTAACCLEMDEPVTAELLLDHVGKEDTASSPELMAQTWHNLGIARYLSANPDGALEAFEVAADYYVRTSIPSNHARLASLRAKIHAEQGNREAAILSISKAFELVEVAGHAVTRVRVLLDAGRIDILLGRFQLSRRWLIQAEELAENLHHAEFLFEARLWRLDLAYREKDRMGARLLAQVLRKQKRSLETGIVLSKAYDGLVGATGDGGLEQ